MWHISILSLKYGSDSMVCVLNNSSEDGVSCYLEFRDIDSLESYFE
jgi:hypothetical protein